MGKNNHYVTSFFLTKEISSLLRYFHRVTVDNSAIFFRLDQSFQFRTESQYSYSESVTLQYDVGLDNPLQRSAGEIIIGTHNGAFQLAIDTGHIFQSEIKFVITDGNGIISHGIDTTHFCITSEHIEE